MCTALFTQNLKDMRDGTRCIIQAQINCSAHKAISTFLQNASHLNITIQPTSDQYAHQQLFACRSCWSGDYQP